MAGDTVAALHRALQAIDGHDARDAELPPLPPADAYEDEAGMGTAKDSLGAKRPARNPLDWRAMASTAPPARDWAVDHWLPMGHAALVAGAGGIGKTLLAQTLGTCLALGYEYVDVIPKPRKVLFWAGEDETTELWRRQLAICDWLNVKLEDLADRFIVESYIGRDITLAVLAYGQLTPTTMMTELQAQIGDYRADYVFVDSVARVFGGSENDRQQS